MPGVARVWLSVASVSKRIIGKAMLNWVFNNKVGFASVQRRAANQATTLRSQPVVATGKQSAQTTHGVWKA